jgi:hypothetical protein
MRDTYYCKDVISPVTAISAYIPVNAQSDSESKDSELAYMYNYFGYRLYSTSYVNIHIKYYNLAYGLRYHDNM